MLNSDLQTELIDSVNCGFNKWTIGLGKDGSVIVDFCYHPNFGTIFLFDASSDDLRNLGEMFISAARNCEKK